jgi:hypothetical protein
VRCVGPHRQNARISARRAPPILAALVTAWAVGVGAPADGAESGPVLTPSGIGHLRIGMALAEARQSSGRRIILSGDAFNPVCRYASVPSLRVFLMLLHGRIARIDITRNSPVHALGGIRRGDTEADVRAFFGQKVTETQHTYEPGGSYLTVGWRSGKYRGRGIRFETNENGIVTNIYAGRHDPIRYVEGCA